MQGLVTQLHNLEVIAEMMEWCVIERDKYDRRLKRYVGDLIGGLERALAIPGALGVFTFNFSYDEGNDICFLTATTGTHECHRSVSSILQNLHDSMEHPEMTYIDLLDTDGKKRGNLLILPSGIVVIEGKHRDLGVLKAIHGFSVCFSGNKGKGAFGLLIETAASYKVKEAENRADVPR